MPVSGGQVTIDLNETPVFLTYTSSQGPAPTSPPLASAQPTLALPAPTQALPPGTAETATVLLLDISGSMGRSWQGGYKIESAKEAALSVVDMIEQESQASGVRHEVAVATFNSGARLDLPLATNYPQVRQAIQFLTPTSGTNMGAGLQQANQALGGVANAKKIIILLSDGLSNEGMSRDQILDGPVRDAAQAGTCIYTVGFGDAQDLDESLLRQIAQAACGQYAYASTPYDLLRVYVEIRHRSSGGTIIDRFGGQIRQDETTQVRTVQVEANQSEMLATTAYGGSRLDLILTDPRGRRVDANYPGATLATYARMAYTIITDPLPGIWQVAVYGASVPEGILDFETILSTRPSAVPVAPSSTGLLLLVVFVAVLMGGGFLGAILYSQSRAGRRPSGIPMAADSGLAFAHDPGHWAAFRGGVLHIGREPSFEMTLTDPRVSRSHARLLKTPQGHVIEDLSSTNGTYVNGHRINRQALRSGDRIQVGDTQLVFWEGGRRPR